MLNLKTSIIDLLKNALADHCQGVFTFDNIKPDEEPLFELCLAYSGGLDSTVLLDVANRVCKKEGIRLTAFHVNHGLSANAMRWQSHCQHECEQRQIPFFSCAVSLKKLAQKSLEAQARDARYSALNNYAQTSKVVLLGQHEDDQAETFLLQLKRGAGVQGLSAMPMYTTHASGTTYLRPFLKLSRAQLLRYAKQHSLHWIEDESNADTRYDRNFLRNQIIPKLTHRWPSINRTIARSADNCAQALLVTTEYMQVLAKDIIDEQCALSIARFTFLSEPTQKSFIRHWLLSLYGLNVSSAQLNSVLSLSKPSQNTSPYIEVKGKAIECFQGKLHVIDMAMTIESDSNPPVDILWHKGNEIRLSAYLVLRLLPNDPKEDTSTIRLPDATHIFRLPKEGLTCVFGGSNLRFKSSQKRPVKKLKTMYQEWQISPLQRRQTPVFALADEAIAVALPQLKISSSNIQNEVVVALLKKSI